MHYKLRDLPALLRTPVGRVQFLNGLFCYRAWPLLASAAAIYRRTLVRRTRLVAVVGSFGKTTTTRAVTTALGMTPHRWSGLNHFGFVAAAIFRIRPGQRHAVVEVGIMFRGAMRR